MLTNCPHPFTTVSVGVESMQTWGPLVAHKLLFITKSLASPLEFSLSLNSLPAWAWAGAELDMMPVIMLTPEMKHWTHRYTHKFLKSQTQKVRNEDLDPGLILCGLVLIMDIFARKKLLPIHTERQTLAFSECFGNIKWETIDLPNSLFHLLENLFGSRLWTEFIIY